MLLVGAPVRRNGRLYNCARGRSRAAGSSASCRRSFLPNYREYYENRWFAPGVGMAGLDDAARRRRRSPFGTDLIFAATRPARTSSSTSRSARTSGPPTPPSTQGALAGALILCNLSASNIVVGKADDRALLCAVAVDALPSPPTSIRRPGPGESTTDLAWDGQATIHELGALLAETERFPPKSQMAVADVDVERLRLERMRTLHVQRARPSPRAIRRRRSGAIALRARAARSTTSASSAASTASPSCPTTRRGSTSDCYEAFNIQVQGLMQAHAGDQRRAHRHRRLGRARFDARADRRRQGVRRARPAAHEHPRLHDAGLRHLARARSRTPGR